MLTVLRTRATLPNPKPEQHLNQNSRTLFAQACTQSRRTRGRNSKQSNPEPYSLMNINPKPQAMNPKAAKIVHQSHFGIRAWEGEPLTPINPIAINLNRAPNKHISPYEMFMPMSYVPCWFLIQDPLLPGGSLLRLLPDAGLEDLPGPPEEAVLGSRGVWGFWGF